jgi:hypothetical protein
MPKEKKVLVGTLTFITNSSTFIWTSIYFWFISKNYEWIIIYAIFANFITAIGVILLPESPDFLYVMKDYDGARQAFNKILWFNR